MKKRVLSLALALSLCVGMLTVPAMAADSKYDDTVGHWAESSIERWSGYNIVEGDDGHFHPNRSLTRGEMAKILANTLGLTDEGKENSFADVPADAWYAPYVLRCAAAGIMEGDGVNAKPVDLITRQETMTVLCRALNIQPDKDADLSAYVDAATVADWAKGYVAAMTKAGIVKGIGGNQLAPAQDVTRGSIMAILDRAVTQYINAPGAYDLTGEGLVLVASGGVTLKGKSAADILVTAAATGKELTFDMAEVTGSVTVQADNAKVVNMNSSTLPQIVALGKDIKTETVAPTPTPKPSRRPSSGGSSGGSSTPTYTNLTVAEAKTVDETATYQDVTITDAVGDGTVTLANMTILGNLYINGGGSNTINLTNVTIKGKIIMAKVGGEKPRLYLTNTPVAAVEVNQPAVIEAADAASAVAAVQAKSDVYVIGADTVVATLTIPAGVETAVNVTVTSGAVTKVEAKGETTVTGATNAVKEVVAEAPVTVTADAVEKVEVPATAPENVTVAVTGAGSVEVAVNSEKGAAITTEADESGNKATVEVSSKLDTLPTVTVDGEEKHIHQWGEWEKVDDASHKRVCKGDESHVETAAHSQTGWVSVDGENHKDSCTVCDWSETKPHHIVAVGEAVAADCLGPGKTEGKKCDHCNTVLEEQKTIEPLGHDFTGDYVSDGESHWHKCSRCDATDTKAAHTYPADATCDNATNCTVCNYEKPAGQHSYDEGKVTTAPTCTEKGVKTFTCTVCKQTKTEDVDALGHDWGEWAKDDNTNHKRVCKRDAAHSETEAHTWDAGVVTTEPTETTEGVKTYTCSACKGTKTESVPANTKWNDLEVSLNNGGDVALTEDIAGKSLSLSGTTPIVFDLAGHNLTLSESIYVEEGVTLTIKDTVGNGSLITTANYAIFNSGGMITIEGGTIKAAQSPLYHGAGNMTIKAGSFIREGECAYVKQALMANGGTITIEGGTFNGGDGGTAMYIASLTEVTISGGTFQGADNGTVIRKNTNTGTLSITGGTFAADVSTYVPETHTCTQNGEVWEVAEK